MADALGTVLTVLELIQKALATYHKIHDCPDQLRLIGTRLEKLSSRLVDVEAFLRRQTIDRSRNDILVAIVEDIRADSARVEALFAKFNNDIGPFGFQFRFKALTQVWFALGSNAEEVKGLAEEIEKHRLDLREELQFMGVVGVDAIKKIVEAELKGVGQQQQQKVAGQAVANHEKKPKAPSPVPGPPRDDYNIIFIDPNGLGRSIVAEAYTKLVREWTVQTGGSWRIKLVHSAGFFVRNRGELDGLVENMEYSHPSYKLNMVTGGKTPNSIALQALFDNKMFGYPFKQAVKEAAEARRSRGMARTLFKTYDYVIVFTNREYDNMVRLRKVLIEKEGKQAVTGSGKGRVLHLGSYLTKDGVPREILAPKGDTNRAEWNLAVGSIKSAMKRFLVKELGWTRPKVGAKLIT